MIIPEVILYNTFIGLLDMFTTDWSNKGDKTTTMLYDMFHVDDNNQPIKITTYDYYVQAQAILLRNSTSPKKLEFFIGYNLQRAANPTVHILLPSDNRGKMDTIGDQQSIATVIQGSEQIESKGKSTSCTYHLMITSDNSSEVLVIYYFLKAVIEVYIEHFELSGLQDLSFSGADINVQQDLTPAGIFHRNLSLSFNYVSTNKIRTPITNASGVLAGVCADIVEDFTPKYPYNG
jgi:hypothetical protein